MEKNHKEKEGKAIMRGILQVTEKTFLTPHYVRITLEGDDICKFSNAVPGNNNKLLIPKDKNKPFTLPDASSPGLNRNSQDYDIRTYTLRALDLERRQMIIDFVAHGEEGPASAWVINCQPDDQLGVFMKDKSKKLFKPAEQYYLVGDHTALPVIATILESIPDSATGKAFIEVYSQDDMLDLQKPEGIEIIWLFNDKPGQTSDLPDQLRAVHISPEISTFVFAAAEAKIAQEAQDILRNNPFLSRDDWQAYSYWKYGESEGSQR